MTRLHLPQRYRRSFPTPSTRGSSLRSAGRTFASGGGAASIVGGQFTGIHQQYATSGAARFQLSRALTVVGLHIWQQGDTNRGTGTQKRAILMDAARGQYLATSAWTTDPLVQGPDDPTEFLFEVPFACSSGVDYWIGYEGDGSQNMNVLYQGNAPVWSGEVLAPAGDPQYVKKFSGTDGSLLAGAGTQNTDNADSLRFGVLA